MDIRRLDESDVELLVAASSLFDETVVEEGARRFLADDGHHCLVASVESQPVGFVTGVAIHHPDKDTEMLLYELGVDAAWRGRGIGRALVGALRDLAAERGMRGVWVLAETDDEVALRTYRSAGASREDAAVVFEWDLRSDP